MSDSKTHPVEKRAGFEYRLEWRPAFDKRHPDPSKNYGIHGVDAVWTLKGPKGEVYFTLYTGWQLPHVTKELEARGCDRYCQFKPNPACVGYHAPTPHYEGQPAHRDACEHFGGPCYSDATFTAAEGVFEIFVAGGESALWAELHEWYDRWFAEVAARV